MEFIKNNKVMCIIIGAILLFIIGVLITLKTFFPSGNEYGNRLKGIEKVRFSKKQISSIKDKVSDNDRVKKVSVNIKGRLVNIIITVKEEAKLDDMKDYCTEKLELFKEKELKYYDIQFYLKNEKDGVKHYPAIGYKHKSSDKIKWSNDD